MRAVQAVTGILIIIVGSVAAITSEFNAAASWILALGFASLGLTGLISAVATSMSVAEST
jgi:hypothetical protein